MEIRRCGHRVLGQQTLGTVQRFVPAMPAAHRATVVRDAYGVPHILADTPADAAYGLGRAQCEDRAVDVVSGLQTGTGRLAELIGPGGRESDRLQRLLRRREAAERRGRLTGREPRAFPFGQPAPVSLVRLPAEQGPRRLTGEPPDQLGHPLAHARSGMAGISASGRFREEVIAHAQAWPRATQVGGGPRSRRHGVDRAQPGRADCAGATGKRIAEVGRAGASRSSARDRHDGWGDRRPLLDGPVPALHE
ncbi:MAG: penicillin acylase family protein [Armatimonadetes bacterium]|nr:penicillin acylase family protein [Armatimonadota bacterium]